MDPFHSLSAPISDVRGEGTLSAITPYGRRAADCNSDASRGHFACYFVGSIKCSYGVPGNMTYG
jgi:hypothetical protein